MMKTKSRLCGLMGFLFLLGFLGFFTGQRLFLAFFAFAPNFQYFFIRSDEMVEEYMSKSAAMAFYVGMVAVALVTLIRFFLSSQGANAALVTGMASGWVVSVLVHSLALIYYQLREGAGLSND